ncbi:hypothetical protein PSN45_003634 [Yamadazyma tenuis]|uniref:NTF2-like protein n=1 Tax=Candida tenuis (strain ATCC 10573 / BCRC 21748 / CBS 615 / JCM 9827 / NBRC 10315 / NRRL Y-1498 / VKM Y-70) TaxID=590646 RepID=G3AZI4_CANTC|nr:NTF2-like protein [Yamadazyma tenuis ATCC 10573]EGV65586.1 NTF2-like protein [Yamadazyma tenuis ATCC 10573]WEJ96098.1 hypothetical protein PSN45_003634 [Yamadazyma tenuis]
MTSSSDVGGSDTKGEAGQTDAKPSAVKLGLDRANSIGWFFIESYYEMYNKNPENLYKLYNSEASISHGDIPGVSQAVRQATGTESIKSLYKDLQAAQIKNKIIVINADIQISLRNSILIVVNGEWSKNSSPYYQFNQTFILSCGINESNYEVANDILRFIDYDFKHDKIVEKEKQTEIAVVEELAEEEPTQNGVTVDDVDEPAEEPEEVAEEQVEESEAAKSDVSEKEQPEPELEAVEFDKEKTEEPAPASGPLSWAALAATAKDKSPKPASVPKTAAKKPTGVATAPTPVPSPSALPNGKYKKEDWFPIYVRGCEDIKEDDLKDHLKMNFGEIKFFKQNSNIALIDFLNVDGQRKALGAKKTVVNGITIFLEVRESKNGRKDPKAKEKPHDAKRKNDKKQVPKKK